MTPCLPSEAKNLMFTIAWIIKILRLKPQNDIATQLVTKEGKWGGKKTKKVFGLLAICVNTKFPIPSSSFQQIDQK